MPRTILAPGAEFTYDWGDQCVEHLDAVVAKLTPQLREQLTRNGPLGHFQARTALRLRLSLGTLSREDEAAAPGVDQRLTAHRLCRPRLDAWTAAVARLDRWLDRLPHGRWAFDVDAMPKQDLRPRPRADHLQRALTCERIGWRSVRATWDGAKLAVHVTGHDYTVLPAPASNPTPVWTAHLQLLTGEQCDLVERWHNQYPNGGLGWSVATADPVLLEQALSMLEAWPRFAAADTTKVKPDPQDVLNALTELPARLRGRLDPGEVFELYRRTSGVAFTQVLAATLATA